MKSFIETFESRVLMSATPILTTVQKQDLAKLATDLQAIHAASDVTTSEVQALVTDVVADVKASHPPSQTSVQKLKTDLKSAFADKQITVAERIELTADVQAVLVSTGIPTSLIEQTETDWKAIVVSSNVTSADVNLIVSDVEALISTFGH